MLFLLIKLNDMILTCKIFQFRSDDSEEEVRGLTPGAEVVPSNTPVNGNSGQASPVMQVS